MTANAGYKTFNTGDVLTAAQVQYNLQNQTVMYFATTTARDAALTGSILVDGMVSYTPATGLMYYNGTAWTYVGSSPTTQSLLQNPVINSQMQVWQRGTSIAITGNVGYTADRWQVYSPGATTTTRQTTSDTTNLPNIQYCQRVQRNSGNTNTSPMYTSQSFETINSIPFVGKTVTLSFYARAGANFSAASNILSAQLATGTGTDQNITGTWTGLATPVNANVTLTTTWQRFTQTATISSTANQIAMTFGYTPVGTAGANDYYEITGVQLDIGSVASPVRTYATTIQGELAACQRYYYRANTSAFGSGWTYSSTNGEIWTTLPVTMRVAPTALDYSGTVQFTDSTNTNNAVSSLALYTGDQNLNTGNITMTGTFTSGRYGVLRASSGTPYVGFSAEL